MGRNLEAEIDALKAVILELAVRGGHKKNDIEYLFHSELVSRTTLPPAMCDYCEVGEGDHCTCQEMAVSSKKTWGCSTCGGSHSSDFTSCPHYADPNQIPDQTINFAGENDYGYLPTDMESPGVLARKICDHATHAESSIAQRDQIWRDFVAAVQASNPCADALDKLWKETILKYRPTYGDWEYPGMAFRHIVCEFEELRQERETLAQRVSLLEKLYLNAESLITAVRTGASRNKMADLWNEYNIIRGLPAGISWIPPESKKINKKAKRRK